MPKSCFICSHLPLPDFLTKVKGLFYKSVFNFSTGKHDLLSQLKHSLDIWHKATKLSSRLGQVYILNCVAASTLI